MKKLKRKGNIFIISAPSGAGKTTICKKVLGSVRTIKPSVSFTTRKPRAGELNGRDYWFVRETEFRKMIERDEFIEWAEVHGNLYGTSGRMMEKLMDAGSDVLLDIDTQGAAAIRKKIRGGIYVFILPPSLKELKARLLNRAANTKADMKRRLGRAAEEIKAVEMYDYVIVNDILKEAVGDLKAILKSEGLRREKSDRRWIEREFLK